MSEQEDAWNMDLAQAFFGLALVVVGSPVALVAILGVAALLGLSLGEFRTNRLTFLSTVIALTCTLCILAGMLLTDRREVILELGNWMAIPEQHFHFHVKFIFDRLSVPMIILSLLLCGTVSAFTSRYLHREPGYDRFMLFYALFTLGMVLSTLAGTIETLFFGWELVGLSSALLVGFFHERPITVRNGFRVWCVYRVADAAFLCAAVALHHSTSAGDLDALIGSGPWPEGRATLTVNQAFWIGMLLLIAAAGKSALVPFSSWLPRAMEGPTPSSAIFYGALSVHLGAYLLLRLGPLLQVSWLLSGAVITVGLLTALYASMTARVQTDIKSALAFASLTQVGLIVAEIGMGLRYIALIHLIGHAVLRTLQLLRAPSLLHDYRELENALGTRPVWGMSRWLERFSPGTRANWYRYAMEQGYLDTYLEEFLVQPFIRLFRWCDRQERSWTDTLAGSSSRESDQVEVHPLLVEEWKA